MQSITHASSHSNQGWQYQQQQQIGSQQTMKTNYKSTGGNNSLNSLQPTQYHQQQHHSVQQPNNFNQQEPTPQQGNSANVIAIPRKKQFDHSNPIPPTLEGMIGKSNKENSHASSNQSKSPAYGHHKLNNQQQQQIQLQKQQQQLQSQKMSQHHSTGSQITAKTIATKELKNTQQAVLANSLLKQLSTQQTGQVCSKKVNTSTTTNHSRNTKFSISGVPQQNQRDLSSTSGIAPSEILSEERNHSIHSKKTSTIPMASSMISTNSNTTTTSTKQHLSGSALRMQEPQQVLPIRIQNNQYVSHSSQSSQVSSAKALSNKAGASQAVSAFPSSQQQRQAGHSANSKKEGSSAIVKVFAVNILTKQTSNQSIPSCSQPSSTGGSHSNSSRKNMEAQQQNYGQIIVTNVRRTESISQGASAKRNDKRSSNLPQNDKQQSGNAQFQVADYQNQQVMQREYHGEQQTDEVTEFIPAFDDQQRLTFSSKYQNLQHQENQFKQQQYYQEQYGHNDNAMLHQYPQQYFQDLERQNPISHNTNENSAPIASKQIRSSDVIKQNRNVMQFPEKEEILDISKQRCSANNKSNQNSICNNPNFFISPHVQPANKQLPVSQALQKKHSIQLATQQPNYPFYLTNKDDIDSQAQPLQLQEFNCDNDDSNDDVIPAHNHLLMQQKYSKRIGISVSAVPDIQKLTIPLNSIGTGKKRAAVDKNLPETKRPPQSISHCPFNQQIVAASSSQNQPTPKDSQPQSAKGNKQIQSLVSQGQQQHEGNLPAKNPHSKERATSSSSSSQQFQPTQSKQINQTNGNLKSRLHVQKIPSFYQHVSSQPSNLSQNNQYYIGNFAGLGSVLPSPPAAGAAGVLSNGISTLTSHQQQQQQQYQQSQFDHLQSGFSTLQAESSKSKFNSKTNNTSAIVSSANQNGFHGISQNIQFQHHHTQEQQQEEAIQSAMHSQREFQSDQIHEMRTDVTREQANSINSQTQNSQQFSLFNNNSKTLAENLIEHKNIIISQPSNLRSQSKQQHQQPSQQRLEVEQISQKDNLIQEESSKYSSYQLHTNNTNFNTLPYNSHHNTGTVGYGDELGGIVKQQFPNHYYYTLQSNPLSSNYQQQQQSDQLSSQQSEQAKQMHEHQPGVVVVSNGSAVWQKEGAVNKNQSSSNNNPQSNANYASTSSAYHTLNAVVVSKEDQLFSNKSDRIFGVVGSNSSSAQAGGKRDQNTLQNDQKPGFQSERLNHQLGQQIPPVQVNPKTTFGMNAMTISTIKHKLNNQGTTDLTAVATNEPTIKPQYQMKSSGDSVKSEYYYPQQQYQAEEAPLIPLQTAQFQPLTSHQTQPKGSHLKANPQAATIKPTIQITRIQPQQQLHQQQPINSQALLLLQQQLFTNSDKNLNNSSSSYISGAHHLPSSGNQPNHSNKSSNQKANHSASLISPLTHSITQAQSSNSFAGPSTTNLRNTQEKGSLPYISSNGNSAQQQQHQNLLSTAIKSETTQFSNFSSDSPLVCTENISGIFSSRYEDNSQFKNFLSTKSNNSANNNCGIAVTATAGGNTQCASVSRQQIPMPGCQSGQNIQQGCLFPEMQENHQSQQESQQSIQGAQEEDETERAHESISHKKTLSNHLIKQFGAICKVATEGQEQQCQQIPNIQSVAKSTLNVENVDNMNSNANPRVILHHHRNPQKESYTLSMLADTKMNQMDLPSTGTLKQQQYAKTTPSAAEILEQIHQLGKNEESSQSFASVCSMIVKDDNGLEQSDLLVESEIDEDQIQAHKLQKLQEELACFEQEGYMAEQITYFEKCGASDKVEYFANPDYFDNQKDITFMMRCILLDWMMEVCMELSMKRDTLYVAVNYVDRYLTMTSDLSKSKLQLIGVVALFMAAKVEEIFPPTIQDFAKSADDGYAIPEIVQAEIDMLQLFDWKLNPATPNLWMTVYTEMWDRFVKCSFDKPNKYQVKFVQDQKLSNKNFIVMYRYPDQKSYTLFRQIGQLLDLMLLDINVLRFESRMLIASIMYLQLGIEYRQFSKSQVHNSFNEKYLFANSLNAFNEYFNSFITQHFHFFLVDLLPSLQYAASFFDVEYIYSLPPAANNHKDNASSQDSYEEFLSFQTYFPAGIEYIRKK